MIILFQSMGEKHEWDIHVYEAYGQHLAWYFQYITCMLL